MFVNSMQLIVHVPLLNVYLPATANLYLIQLLSIVRLHVGSLDEALAKLFGLDASSGKENYDAIKEVSEGTYYNELIHACGYHVSIGRNLLVILTLASLVFILWMGVALRD